MKKDKKLINVIAIVFVIGGIIIFMHPIICNKIVEKYQLDIIENYEKVVSENSFLLD